MAHRRVKVDFKVVAEVCIQLGKVTRAEMLARGSARAEVVGECCSVSLTIHDGSCCAQSDKR